MIFMVMILKIVLILIPLLWESKLIRTQPIALSDIEIVNEWQQHIHSIYTKMDNIILDMALTMYFMEAQNRNNIK